MNDIWPNWSAAIRVDELFSRMGRRKITPDQSGDRRYTGLYAFSTDEGPLTRANTLYVGIARGAKQSIRARLGCYLRRMQRRGPKLSKHAGADMLVRHYSEGDQRLGATEAPSATNPIFVRWSKCADPAQWEGTLIEELDPPYNTKDEANFADDEFELEMGFA